ncbi:MAG: hypothetical protein KDB03_17405, partial [Planctomycetales bacterium]|nr:hypothetical protein [Planctomycetales bacterium]
MNESNGLLRRELVRLSAGLISGLGIPGFLTPHVRAEEQQKVSALTLDVSYLEKGLVGMARSQGWFNAHLGAAVIAGYYLCQENRLSDELVESIRRQLDALIRTYDSQFKPFENLKADANSISSIPQSLKPVVDGGLRAHGHGVIYTSLAIRALGEVPYMADPRLIKLICDHNAEIARKTPTAPRTPVEYKDTKAMVEALFDSLARFEPLLGYPTVRRPNFTHMTTHTEALMTLESLGYPELSKAGHLGHQAHIEEPVPDFRPADHPRQEIHSNLADVMSVRFWNDEENQKQWNQAWKVNENPNGYWLAFGHLFKVLYAYHRLIKR